MAVFALADPHLSFGVPQKTMEAFGSLWKDYTDKIAENWRAKIGKNDLVLIPGDISWATHFEDALVDLRWIDQLPGTKVIIRGNHDFWWPSASKLKASLPPSIHFIQNNVFNWQGITIGGARLWDTDEFNFHHFIHFQENTRTKKKSPEEFSLHVEESKKIFERELVRLELSLKQLDPQARVRIALTHYPPVSADMQPSRASALLEKYQVQIVVFGHLHNVKKDLPLFGEARGIRYILSSCDYLDFNPLLIL
ncbi:MAG: metallophosphoesterase [Chlamydiales bacterium]